MQPLNKYLSHPTLLAPMVGLSHVALRKALQDCGNTKLETLWTTEMLNSRKLPHQPLGDTPETVKSEQDYNLYPQILGNSENYIRDSIAKLKDWGAVAIDINMGCPVQKALKHNYGVSLMGDRKYAGEVVAMATKNTDLPVSVKLRAGIEKDNKFLLQFCETLLENGASWLTLHPRLAGEKRKGEADWKQIKLLKDTFGVPIIGNGDIQCVEDLQQMREQTGCDAVMIGRALTAKPWLLFHGDDTSLLPTDPHEQAKVYGQLLIKHAQSCFEFFNEKNAFKRIYFHIRVSHVWLNFGHGLYKGVMKCKEKDELFDFLERYFEKDCLLMSKRTRLRY